MSAEMKERIKEMEHLLDAAIVRYEAKCAELAALRESHGLAPTVPVETRVLTVITSPIEDDGFWPGFPWSDPPKGAA